MAQENANSLQTGRPWYFRFMRQWLFKLGTDRVATGISDPTKTKVSIYLGDKQGDYRFGQITISELSKIVIQTEGNVTASGKIYGDVTGSVSRSAFTIYTGTTHGGSYSQSDVQALDDATKAVSARLGALINDLKNTGAIG